MNGTGVEEFLGIEPGDVLSFVGGGGKSTLIHSLAARLVREGKTAITTATRPFLPAPGESPYFFLTDERPIGDLRPILGEHGTITVARERREDGVLVGYPPDEVDTFADLADFLFVEAEDAGGESLPPPRPNRRAFPPITSVGCAVAGLDALGPDLDCAAFAARLLEPGGVLAALSGEGRRILFLNKADRRSIQLDGARVTAAVREGAGPDLADLKVVLTSVRDVLRRL